jgi:serine/threonine-protein kinase
VRDPVIWGDRLALERLAAQVRETTGAEQPPQLLMTLAGLLDQVKADPVPLLRAVQQRRPGEYWLNHALGRVLLAAMPAESVGFWRAALALRPRDALTTFRLGWALEMAGRLEEALAAYRRAIAFDPGFHDAWNRAATLWLQTGDRAGYRGHCRRMLDRFGRTTVPPIAERTAKACLLLPLGGPEQEAACDLADRAVAMARGHFVEPWAEATRGLAAYRRAQFADAVAWADRCLARGPGYWNRELPAHLVRAMALSRLGRLDEARAALATASDLYRARVANPGGRATGDDWHDRVICEILRREAEAVFLDRDFPADPFAR